MSHSQFHCTGRVYLDLHGLIFETSICYWQDQPGSPLISIQFPYPATQAHSTPTPLARARRSVSGQTSEGGLAIDRQRVGDGQRRQGGWVDHSPSASDRLRTQGC